MGKYKTFDPRLTLLQNLPVSSGKVLNDLGIRAVPAFLLMSAVCISIAEDISFCLKQIVNTEEQQQFILFKAKKIPDMQQQPFLLLKFIFFLVSNIKVK